MKSKRGVRARQVVEALCLCSAVFVVGACVLWPALALWNSAEFGSLATTSELGTSAALPLFVRSVSYALTAALLGACIVWPAARSFRASHHNALRTVLAVMIVLPLVLAPWLLYAALWLSVGPGTALGDFAQRADCVGVLRQVTLMISLVACSGALVFAALALGASNTPAHCARLLALEGASRIARIRAAWRGLCVGYRCGWRR